VISLKEDLDFSLAFAVVGYQDRIGRDDPDYVHWDVFIKESVDGV